MNLSISDLPNLQALLLLAESPAVKLELEKLIKRAETSSQDSPPSPAPVPVSAPVSAPSPAPCPPQPSRTTATSAYTPITTFLFDEGEYNSATVTLHINLPNVGANKSNVSCDFTKSSFDLKILDLEGKSYRLFNNNLSNDINPDKSKFVVKPNKVLVKLGKIKGEYSYDTWSELSNKKKNKDSAKKKNADPSSSINDMMKEMYENGDDSMRKIIGESMLKSRSGEKMEPPGGAGDFDADVDDL